MLSTWWTSSSKGKENINHFEPCNNKIEWKLKINSCEKIIYIYIGNCLHMHISQ